MFSKIVFHLTVYTLRAPCPKGQGIRKCEECYFWAVTPPSHTSFGPRFLHQCPRWPNGAKFGCLDGWSHWWRCSQRAGGWWTQRPFRCRRQWRRPSTWRRGRASPTPAASPGRPRAPVGLLPSSPPWRRGGRGRPNGGRVCAPSSDRRPPAAPAPSAAARPPAPRRPRQRRRRRWRPAGRGGERAAGVGPSTAPPPPRGATDGVQAGGGERRGSRHPPWRRPRRRPPAYVCRRCRCRCRRPWRRGRRRRAGTGLGGPAGNVGGPVDARVVPHPRLHPASPPEKPRARGEHLGLARTRAALATQAGDRPGVQHPLGRCRLPRPPPRGGRLAPANPIAPLFHHAHPVGQPAAPPP